MKWADQQVAECATRFRATYGPMWPALTSVVRMPLLVSFVAMDIDEDVPVWAMWDAVQRVAVYLHSESPMRFT